MAGDHAAVEASVMEGLWLVASDQDDWNYALPYQVKGDAVNGGRFLAAGRGDGRFWVGRLKKWAPRLEAREAIERMDAAARDEVVFPVAFSGWPARSDKSVRCMQRHLNRAVQDWTDEIGSPDYCEIVDVERHELTQAGWRRSAVVATRRTS